jgi:N-acetylmuramoyl-L-alanine amidase
MPRIYFSPSTQERNAGVIPGYIEETEMNLIADIAIPLLQFNGFEVFRNDRTKDHIAAKNESNAIGVDAHFALHSNAGGGEGTVAFTSGSEKGRRLAQCVYDEVAAISPSPDRGVRITKVFTEVVKTIAPATLIEVAFHDNLADAQWIQANHQEIAEAICRGLCKYFGVTFRKPEPIPEKVQAPEGFIYRVRAGAYTYAENAQIQVEKLEKAGFKAYVKLEPR